MRIEVDCPRNLVGEELEGAYVTQVPKTGATLEDIDGVAAFADSIASSWFEGNDGGFWKRLTFHFGNYTQEVRISEVRSLRLRNQHYRRGGLRIVSVWNWQN